MDKYFVCHRFRAYVSNEYVQNFYNKKKYSKLHNTYKEAYKELREGFYDDSDYGVYKVTDGRYFERINQ